MVKKVEHVRRESYTWPCPGVLADGGQCDVELYRGEFLSVLVLEDRYPGPSVQNWVEELSARLSQEYELAPGSLAVIEYFPHDAKSAPMEDDHWNLVHLSQKKEGGDRPDSAGYDGSRTRWTRIDEHVAHTIVTVVPGLEKRRELEQFLALIAKGNRMASGGENAWGGKGLSESYPA